MENLQRTFLSALIILICLSSKNANAICGLSNEDVLCQDFVQASLEANDWPNCTNFCIFEIYAGTYQGQDVIVLAEGCETNTGYDQIWEIYTCSGILLEQCSTAPGGSCIVGGGILDNVTYVDNLFACGETLPPCSPGGGLCDFLECADQEVVVASDIFGGIHVDDVVVESSGDCNLSFSSTIDLDYIDLSCADVGVFTITVYSLDNPAVNCQAQITVIDNGCFIFCEEFECLDFTTTVSQIAGAIVTVDDLVIGADPSCNFSFDAEIDIDDFEFECSDVGVFQLTVYNLDNPQFNCISTITIVDGGCLGSDCVIYECEDVEVFPEFDVIPVVDVTQVALEYEGDCNLSFSATEDIDQLSYDCSQLGTYQVTVYHLGDPSINCTATITVSDGGCTVPGECDHPDYETLVSIYNSTNGDSWDENGTNTLPTSSTEGWLKDCDICNWVGITCDQEGRVSVLNLRSNNLTGGLPADLSGLSKLVELRMQLNDMTGGMPTLLGHPNFLEEVWLSYNDFEGSIPPSWMNSSKIRVLSLSGNSLTGTIPFDIGLLTDLTSLFIADNQLSGSIPISIANCQNLYSFWADDNQLSGDLPEEAFASPILNSIDLTNNNLTGSIPSGIASAVNLSQLKLGQNNLSGSIPVEVGTINSLSRIEFQNNSLSGSIPESLGSLSELTSLIFSANMLEGSVPSTLGNLSMLTRLYLNDNKLSGCIPAEVQVHCVLMQNSAAQVFQDGYSFLGNPALAWSGDYERVCMGESQIGAPCNDGLASNGTSDVIGDDCNCGDLNVAVQNVKAVEVNLYPNPTFGILHIDQTGMDVSSCVVQDISGRVMSRYNITKSGAIDISNLKSGIYVIQLLDNNGKLLSFKKVIKM